MLQPKYILVLLLLNMLLHFSSIKSQPNCLNSETYTSNSTYESNLNTLISSLSTNIGSSGFYNASVGQNPDRIEAIVLCRGDQLLSVCHDCVNTTAHQLVQRCFNNKEAIFWNEFCLVRYSNNPIFGILQADPVSPVPSSVRVVENAQIHDRELRALLESLRTPAANGVMKKIAAGNRSAPGIQTIYALEQCTPNLSEQDCVTCLTRSIEFFPRCCGGVIGSGILRPSCTLRFENYRFFNASMVDQVPQEPLATGGDDGSNRIFVIVFVPIAVLIVLAIGLVIFWRRRKYQKLKNRLNGAGEDVDPFSEDESQHYDLDTIRTATDDFSDANKLGEGGFGSVYRGTINQREIAVKRMSSHSGQGVRELKTEIQLLARLQHRNLVRLLGFCIQKGERILVYEFVQNGSLDHYIFDPIKSSYLDWEKRYRIIGGIAKGLLYLHEDSRLRIIHRDLKAGNVLLDGDMNPKIADFGMARLFVRDESQGSTKMIVGTYGYMAPEYVMHGLFSVKSDVFSFGVLVLEIITGQRCTAFTSGETAEDLLNYAWKNWREGSAAEVVDPKVRASTDSVRDILSCIHMGLLCVQENAAERPTMASVVLMLNSSSVTMAAPSRPAFYMPSFDRLSVVEESTSAASGTQPSINDVSITQLDAR